MKATSFYSMATLATAASAAPLLDDAVDTLEGVVGNVPVVSDLLQVVPAENLLDGVVTRLPTDELINRLPIKEIVNGLPVQDIIAQLPYAKIAEGLPIVGDAVSDENKKRDITDSIGGIPLLGELLDSLPVSELLGEIFSTLAQLSPDALLDLLPAQKIVAALPPQDIIDRLPVKDVVAQLPIAGDVTQTTPSNKRDLGTLPIVGALLDMVPTTDLLDGVVGLLTVDGIISRLSIQDIVARLPVKDIIAALPADVANTLPTKRAEAAIVGRLDTIVIGVKEHTKLINATVAKVEAGKIHKAEAQAAVISEVKLIEVKIKDFLSQLSSSHSTIAITAGETDVVVAHLNSLLAEVLAVSQSVASRVGLRAKIITPLHAVFSKSSKLVTVLGGFQAGIVPGVAATLGPLLTGFSGGLLAPVLAPLLSIVVGAVSV